MLPISQLLVSFHERPRDKWSKETKKKPAILNQEWKPISTHYLLPGQIKLDHIKAGSKAVFCSKKPPAKNSIFYSSFEG